MCHVIHHGRKQMKIILLMEFTLCCAMQPTISKMKSKSYSL